MVFTRVQGETRLEQKSFQERETSFIDGWHVFRGVLWTGVGPGNFVLKNARDGRASHPPHFLPMLILSEVGIIGVLGLMTLAFIFLRGTGRSSLQNISLLAAFVILGFFDHYLWSFWAGQSLLFLGFFLVKNA